MTQLDEVKKKIRAAGSPFHVGLTGGIASGKTTIANMFHECGAHLIDFDLLAREVVAPGTAGLSQIVAIFGEKILTSDGTLDRKALSGIVFNDPAKRKTLESILHPAIFELFCQRVDEIVGKKSGKNALSVDDPGKITVYPTSSPVGTLLFNGEAENIVNIKKEQCHNHDAKNHPIVIFSVIPLLIEMNLQPLFDRIVVVHVSADVQLKRLMERDGIDEPTAQKIMASQLPIDEKRQHADFLVDNSLDLAESRRQVTGVWDQLAKM